MDRRTTITDYAARIRASEEGSDYGQSGRVVPHDGLTAARALHCPGLWLGAFKGLNMGAFIDADWADAAERNAAKGFGWHTWGKRGDRPLDLLGSHRTQAEAERYAASERAGLRPRGDWTVIVSQ